LHQDHFKLKETEKWVIWWMQGTRYISFTIPKSCRVLAYDLARQYPKCEVMDEHYTSQSWHKL